MKTAVLLPPLELPNNATVTHHLQLSLVGMHELSREPANARRGAPERHGPSDALVKNSGEPAICKEDTRRLQVHAKVVFTHLRYAISIGNSTAMPWSCLSAADKTWCGNFAHIDRRAIHRTKKSNAQAPCTRTS